MNYNRTLNDPFLPVSQPTMAEKIAANQLVDPKEYDYASGERGTAPAITSTDNTMRNLIIGAVIVYMITRYR